MRTDRKNRGGQHGQVGRGGFLSRWRSYACREEGVAAIEFALILPVLIILFVGMIELTLRLSESRKTTLFAGMVGDLVSQNETGQITDTELNDYFQAARYVLLPFDESRVYVRVASFSYDADEEQIKRDWELTQGGLDPTKCAEITMDDVPTELEGVIESGVSIIMTRVCRQPRTVIAKMLNMNLEEAPIYVRDSFYRPRYVNSISCTGGCS